MWDSAISVVVPRMVHLRNSVLFVVNNRLLPKFGIVVVNNSPSVCLHRGKMGKQLNILNQSWEWTSHVSFLISVEIYAALECHSKVHVNYNIHNSILLAVVSIYV